ncbi:unnamed protein product [Camellia sinensis]
MLIRGMQKLHQNQAIGLQEETLDTLLECPTHCMENRSSLCLLRREHRRPQNGFMLDNVVISIQPNPSQPSSIRNRDPRPIDNNPLLRKICKGKGSILSPESPCASCWSPVKVKRVAGNAPQKPVECPADESSQSHLCPEYMRYSFDSASRRPFDEKILYCGLPNAAIVV